MSILQLNPPLPVFVVDKGAGLAHFLIDYGIEFDLYFVVFMNDTCECWTVVNSDIRGQYNITLGRVPHKGDFPTIY